MKYTQKYLILTRSFPYIQNPCRVIIIDTFLFLDFCTRTSSRDRWTPSHAVLSFLDLENLPQSEASRVRPTDSRGASQVEIDESKSR